ncbi:hypothetical protein DRO42_02335 [Candidatus Bathyarchaeota archaeon]|nr:MAG: hypothetical protein DRO42_02335 [Candidatus Bathyarchaeota archaeon]
MVTCVKCGARLEAGVCPNCGYNPLSFSEGDLSITLLSADGVRVPASNLFYRNEGCVLVGELTYSHAHVEKVVKRRGKEEVVEYDTITPVLVWALHGGGGVERSLKPLQMARTLNVAGRTVLVELKTRSAAVFDTLIDLDVAREFVEGRDCIGWREAYDRIKAELRRFVSFGWDPRLYDVVSCWVLGTYFVEAFSTYPFLYPYGSQGSGKSRLLFTATLLSRHGFIATDPSDASLYRSAEAFRPSMGVDESLLGKGAWKIIRTAFKRGTKVPRVEKTSKDEFILGLFETYMPVIFASTEKPTQLGGQEADEARAIFLYMQQERDPIGRDPEVSDFHDLRNELYLLRLLRIGEVLKILRVEEEAIRGFRGHEREVWLPIFTIARIVGEDVYGAVTEYAAEANAIKRLSQYRDEKLIIGAICQVFRLSKTETLKRERAVEFKASDLLPHIKVLLEEAGEYDEAAFSKFWTARRVGRILSRMSLFKRLLHGRTRYTVTAKTYGDLVRRYDYGKGGLGGLGGQKNKGYRDKDNPPQPKGGLDKHLHPLKNIPPNPPNPPPEPLQDKMERVLEALQGFPDKVSEFGLNQKLRMDPEELRRVLELLKQDRRVFNPAPGYWRAASP